MLQATRSRVLLFLASVSFAALPLGPDATARQTVLDPGGLARGPDGSLRLSVNVVPAPRAAGAWERFGMWDSPPADVSAAFDAVQVRYRADVPVGTQSFVAVRASVDGRRWSEWEWDVKDGAVVSFGPRQRWVQHRVVMFGDASRTPVVSPVQVMPQPAGMRSMAQAASEEPFAPTYRLRVTRQGMVGGRTANGHIIKSRDFFVSLPSWRSLSSRYGSEYMVRLSANGRSVVVRVADVGPWNYHDNYWSANREKFANLPVGWPEDHAAYYEGYNRRWAERGWVRWPSAVDIGDGAYWALGLGGSQTTVDVTFLWLGRDPGPNPKPLNAAPSQRP